MSVLIQEIYVFFKPKQNSGFIFNLKKSRVLKAREGTTFFKIGHFVSPPPFSVTAFIYFLFIYLFFKKLCVFKTDVYIYPQMHKIHCSFLSSLPFKFIFKQLVLLSLYICINKHVDVYNADPRYRILSIYFFILIHALL